MIFKARKKKWESARAKVFEKLNLKEKKSSLVSSPRIMQN